MHYTYLYDNMLANLMSMRKIYSIFPIQAVILKKIIKYCIICSYYYMNLNVNITQLFIFP